MDTSRKHKIEPNIQIGKPQKYHHLHARNFGGEKELAADVVLLSVSSPSESEAVFSLFVWNLYFIMCVCFSLSVCVCVVCYALTTHNLKPIYVEV